MQLSSDYRARRNAKGELSPMGLLLMGCVAVLLLGGLLLLLHGGNTRGRGIDYTLEAGMPLPDASDLCGISGASYPSDMPDLICPGEYHIEISTAQGRRTLLLTVVDTTPPAIEGVADITVYVGESVAYRKNITVTDNAGSEGVSLQVDSTAVNTAQQGAYTVIYSATDAAGNTASKTASVYVKTQNTNEPLLMDGVAKICGEILRPTMSNEDKLRAVYEYVQSNISYVNHSDKTDWVGEAYNGLFVTGSGDCFTYFAAAKAFLIYLDIPFIELQRAPGLTEETHYWMLVNISDTPGVRTWYHYDATRLRAEYNHSGCLLTDKQAQAYNKVRPHFYTHSTADLPATSDIIITDTPELEPYY